MEFIAELIFLHIEFIRRKQTTMNKFLNLWLLIFFIWCFSFNKGAEAFVVGHAAFGQEHRLKPTVTRGVISKVIFHKNVPIIIQVACFVFQHLNFF